MCLDTQHHLFQMYWLKGLKHKIKKNNSVIKTQLSFCLKLNFPDKKLKYHFFLTFFQLLFFFSPIFSCYPNTSLTSVLKLTLQFNLVESSIYQSFQQELKIQIPTQPKIHKTLGGASNISTKFFSSMSNLQSNQNKFMENY